MLTLFGTTRTQLRRLVWLENTLLSGLAILAGILLGLLFNRLFFLGLARVLQVEQPLSVQLVPLALLATAGGFFLLFQAVIVLSSFGLGRRSVLELLQDARRPRAAPRARPIVAILGLLLMGTGYIVALLAEQAAVVVAFVPVVVVVVTGTYLVFSEATVWVLNRLRRSAGYLQGTTMLSVSQLVFRLKDNARLLATITNLSAVVLAAAGTFYIVTQLFYQGVDEMYPTALSIHEGAGLEPETVIGLARSHGIDVTAHGTVSVHLLDAYVVSESGAAALAAAGGITLVPSDPVPFEVEGETVIATPLEVGLTMVPVAGSAWYAVPDETWDALSGTPFRVDYFDWEDSPRVGLVSSELERIVGPDDWFRYAADRYGEYRSLLQVLSMSMFTGLFVSLLFFIGTGSLIYFKLFTELPEDRRTNVRLRRIGATTREIRRHVTTQIAVVFLLPFVAGSIHAVVALDALGGLLMVNVIGYSLMVVALFAAVQFAFFLLTRWTYLRALSPYRSGLG